MGALYGVGMGSAMPPRFIILEYVPQGAENDAPIALVGKGMSFDTGGYSLKPSTSMEDMKDDMAGAGVVLGVMSALRHLGYPKRVLGIIASAENMVSERAQRPGDIVTARSGKTIEVLNTDAEGRLILADALTYACEQKPAAIVDFATLTGAIGIALGQEAAGLFSNDNALSAQLIASGEYVAERIWRLPLWEEYHEYIKGTISDLKNIGPERRAGSIAAAAFLEEFVEDGIPWAHLDIAAVSLVKSEKFLTERGGTGFGVRLILDYLRS
jgi:leucyl aminopeptidase